MLYTKIKGRKPGSLMTQQDCINLKNILTEQKNSPRELQKIVTLYVTLQAIQAKFSKRTFRKWLHFMLYTKIKGKKSGSLMTQQSCISLKKHPNGIKKFSERTLKDSYTLCYAPGNTSKVLQENF